MVMLSTDRIQGILGRALSAIYETAVLQVWRRSTTRDPETGEFPYAMVSQHQVRVQRDACSVSQTASPGYEVSDVRFLVLQTSAPFAPTSDCRIVYRGETYEVQPPIDQDPARVYWDVRARRIP